jgi:hypothetical protein
MYVYMYMLRGGRTGTLLGGLSAGLIFRSVCGAGCGERPAARLSACWWEVSGYASMNVYSLTYINEMCIHEYTLMECVFTAQRMLVGAEPSYEYRNIHFINVY